MSRIRQIAAILLLIAVPVVSFAGAIGTMYCEQAPTSHGDHSSHEGHSSILDFDSDCDCGCQCDSQCALSCSVAASTLANAEISYSPFTRKSVSISDTRIISSLAFAPPLRPPISSS